jgi:hypothetical protein
LRSEIRIIKHGAESHHPRLAPCGSRATQLHRGGYTLVFFAMLMFALMGLAALVVDIGFARLTQRQMQTAVDSAALEGLRWKDVNEWEEVPLGWLGDPAFIALFDVNEDFIGTITNDVDKERIRRWAAQQVVLSTFDDDLESGNGDDGAFYDAANPDPNAGEQFNVEGQFGAGPILEFADGVNDNEPVGDTKLAASKFIHAESNPNPNPEVGSYRETPFYKPESEVNIRNEIHGDLVTGNYLEDEAILDDEMAHNESTDYVRTDFGLPGDSAFLSRLRRTNDFDGLDNIAGESSSGPPLPYLFGRGSLLAFRDPSLTYSPRHHGMTVRATGIADSRSVKTVGHAIPAGVYVGFAGMAGVAPFAVDQDWPMSDPVLCGVTNLTQDVTATDTQLLVASNTGFPPTPFRILVGNEVMSVVDSSALTTWTVERGFAATSAENHLANVTVLLYESVQIGVGRSSIEGSSLTQGLSSLDPNVFRYVPVFDFVAGVPVVVGFREADNWTFDEVTHELAVSFTADSRVVSQNASAHVLFPFTQPPTSDVEGLIRKNQTLANRLLAPLSVR